MAKTDIINIRGNTSRCVNLSRSVGIGGANQRSDVMLIQALLYYLSFNGEANILRLPVYLPTIDLMVGVTASITGHLDAFTIMTINIFQGMHRHRLLRYDGLIEPAKYQGRIIKDSTEPLMTITYLHLLAKKVELVKGSDYITDLRSLMPEVRL